MNSIDTSQQSSMVGTTHVRQIAILLSSLPERTHRVLLGQLSEVDRRRISDRVLALGDVDAMERYRVLKRMHEQLHAETRSVEKVESEIQDEIQIGRARVSKSRSTTRYRAHQSDFADAEGDASGEASKAGIDGDPHHAPSPFATQADILTGQAAAVPDHELLQKLFSQFHQTQAAGVLAATPRPTDAAGATHSAATFDPSPATVPFPTAAAATESQPNERGPTAQRKDPEELAERVDRFLIHLPTPTLCRALGLVSTRQAFLVLCGLPNETAETILETLPRRTARKVRGDMRKMGQLQLSEIDAAKRRVTEVAIRMATGPQTIAA